VLYIDLAKIDQNLPIILEFEHKFLMGIKHQCFTCPKKSERCAKRWKKSKRS